MPTAKNTGTSLTIHLCVGFLTLAAVALWPPTSGRILVVTFQETSGRDFWAILHDTEGRVVEVIDDHLAVVESSEPGFARKLMKNGALLLMNPAGAYGCGQLGRSTFRKEELHD